MLINYVLFTVLDVFAVAGHGKFIHYQIINIRQEIKILLAYETIGAQLDVPKSNPSRLCLRIMLSFDHSAHV